MCPPGTSHTLLQPATNKKSLVVNSGSFAKRVQAPGNWTDDETEKFYRLLGMFGTDFETISRLFPGKNRRAIKLKFNKEVSHNCHYLVSLLPSLTHA